MLQPRIIPVLLMKDGGLVKTVRFKNPTYIGDPINAVKIFNAKGADELLIINLDASITGKPMDLKQLETIATEAFMPVAYGGGVRTLNDIERVVNCGVEKVVVNTAAIKDETFVKYSTKAFGSSTIVVSVDYKMNWFGKSQVCSERGTVNSRYDVLSFCKLMEANGVGEILLHNVERDGTRKGYDQKLLKEISVACRVPVTICGGASSRDDLSLAFANGASGAAAGSLFVFSGPHRAVLINYPDETWRREHLHAD